MRGTQRDSTGAPVEANGHGGKRIVHPLKRLKHATVYHLTLELVIDLEHDLDPKVI